MTDIPQRSASISTMASRAARAATAPYAKPIGDWNIELARLRGLLNSPRCTGQERHTARMTAVALLSEVRRREGEMALAVAGQSSHSVIEDLKKSYGRLSSQLTEIVELAQPVQA